MCSVLQAHERLIGDNGKSLPTFECMQARSVATRARVCACVCVCVRACVCDTMLYASALGVKQRAPG